MMAILLVKNVIQINNKLKSQNNAEIDRIFETRKIVESENTSTCFCPNCGTKTENGAFCTNCGSKL